MILYDLHTHSIHSDGELIPSESARRAKMAGYGGIAVTDHADASNLSFLLDGILRFKETYNKSSEDFKVLAGVELTHVKPGDVGPLTELARLRGADIVVVHGETIAEPVEEGTNRAAIEAGADILAHPGLISEEDAREAAKNGVALEITTRRGHAYANARVANMARLAGAALVINNDAHAPSDYAGMEKSVKIMLGAGLTEEEIKKTIETNKKIFEKVLGGKYHGPTN